MTYLFPIPSSTDPLAWHDGGDAFGPGAELGTSGANAINFETNGLTRATITSAGNMEIPTTLDLISGGDFSASDKAEGCVGFIAEGPDLRLTFSAKEMANALPLYITAQSDQDTTLVIKAPDGKFYCSDDTVNGTDPVVVFGPAQDGEYDIWVGSFDQDLYHDATLSISELGVR